jgi:tRNA(Arg) A34 adenosine deaminase TadA
MCTGAFLWAGVSRVVFGASIRQLIDVGQPQIETSSQSIARTAFCEVELTGGVLAEEALEVVRGWRK